MTGEVRQGAAAHQADGTTLCRHQLMHLRSMLHVHTGNTGHLRRGGQVHGP